MLPFRRIRWVKSVSLDAGQLAYPGRAGTKFELHSTPEDADSLQDPEVGDLVALTQHDQVTHLVRVVGEDVEPRPRRTIKRGTRDERFSMQRTCEHVIVRGFDEAPFLDEAFGCDPDTTGGEVLRIDELPAVINSEQPMWMVQRRLLNALQGPSAQLLYETRHERRAANEGPTVDLAEFLDRG